MTTKGGQAIEVKGGGAGDPAGADVAAAISAVQNRINDLTLKIDDLTTGRATDSAATKGELAAVKAELVIAKEKLGQLETGRGAGAVLEAAEGGWEYGWWS